MQTALALVFGFVTLCAFIALVNVPAYDGRRSLNEHFDRNTRRMLWSLGFWLLGLGGIFVLALRSCL